MGGFADLRPVDLDVSCFDLGVAGGNRIAQIAYASSLFSTTLGLSAHSRISSGYLCGEYSALRLA